jgi:hypothetical protein
LTNLNVSGCSSIKNLQDSIGQLCHLEALEMSGWHTLSILPKCMSQLTAVTTLDLSDCSGLTSIAGPLSFMTALQHLGLSGCSSLASLPELSSNNRLEVLDLEECSSLMRVPETLGQLQQLQLLNLSGCHQITALPLFMDMTSLYALKLQSCYSLKTLPRAVSENLGWLDLSYCSEVDSLAESLVKLEATLVKAGTMVGLLGWGNILAAQEPVTCLMIPFVDGPRLVGHIKMDAENALLLRRATIIQRLLGDQGTVLELLSRLSWLGGLLAAATFAAALAPPGGYDNGLLFLSYSAADCRGSNQAAAYSFEAHCTSSGSRQNCTISDADLRGCVRRPDQCTSIEGASCRVQPSQSLLLWFFVFDLLSFGFSMVLVMFVVACSIPRTGRSEPHTAAGLIWLSLVVASSLLIAAVGSGMLALLFGLRAVYPLALRAWLWGPWCTMVGLMVLMVALLLARWAAIYPGPAAVRAASRSLVQPVADTIHGIFFMAV